MNAEADASCLLVFSTGRWRSVQTARALRSAGLAVAVSHGRRVSALSVEVPAGSADAIELVRRVTDRDPSVRLVHRSDLPSRIDVPTGRRPGQPPGR